MFIGLVSYSWYLWHWPILAYSYYWSPRVGVGIRCLAVAASFALAVVSWKFVETPIRRRKLFGGRRSLITFGLLTWLTLGLAAGYTIRSAPPDNLDSDWTVETQGLAQAEAGAFPSIGLRDPDAPIDFILWGDSYATCLVAAIDPLARAAGRRGVIAAHRETPPLLGFCTEGPEALGDDGTPYNQAILNFIIEHHIRNVILAARWATYDRPGIELSIDQTLRALEESGCVTWWVAQVPDQPENVPRRLAKAALRGEDPVQLGSTLHEHQRHTGHITDLIQHFRRAHTQIIDCAEFFFEDGDHSRIVFNGHCLYRDEGHLTPYGARQLRPFFEPIFRSP